MTDSSELIRSMTAKDAILLVVGNIIGIGIFTTTGYISGYVPTAQMMLLLWVVGGLLAFCGSLTYSELASRFPMAGGDFHYLSHAYHPLVGFLFGWSTFTVTYTGSIATISMGFAYYFTHLLPAALTTYQFKIPGLPIYVDAIKIVAITITFLLTFLNVRGIRSGTRWQNLFTVLSLAVLMGFIVMGITSPNGNWKHLWSGFAQPLGMPLMSAMGVALIGVYFTYSGWTALAYVAGEIRNPRKTIPLAMGVGVIVVGVLYFVVNSVYFYAFPISDMRNIVDIGYQSFLALRGESWSRFFNIMILLAVLSTLNATILSGARIYYAMSREKQFFPAAGQLHPRIRSPSRALWWQLIWTILLIFSGSFNQLLTYTVFIMVLFAFLSGTGLFLLRRKSPRAPDIYKVHAYPLTPLVFITITGWIMLNTLWEHPIQSLLGIAAVLTGLPFYLYFRRSGPVNIKGDN